METTNLTFEQLSSTSLQEANSRNELAELTGLDQVRFASFELELTVQPEVVGRNVPYSLIQHVLAEEVGTELRLTSM